MANKLATVTGNFITAGTWVTASRALISTSTSTTALTTGNLDSSNFTLAATQIQYLAIRVGTRAAGAGANKMTVILRNTTAGSNTWTFVINVSDLDACANTTDDNSGWYIFKAASAFTPNGTDGYVVRCVLDSTSTAVALSTNGTANNWQSQIFGTATSAPVAGDDMLIGGIWDTTNPAVKTNVVVTMNETADTDYGSNTTTYRTAALNIGKGGSLVFATAADSNLRLSGFLEVYSGGTLSQGTSVTPIARTKVAKLRFDPVADIDRGLEVRLGGTRNIYGVSPLVGVNNTYALQTADLAAAATSITVDRQLSAANGDTVGLAASATRLLYESGTISADATGTTVTLSVGATNAHSGTNGKQCEVFSLTRNARVESVTSTLMTFEYWMAGATCNADWASWQYVGQGTTIAGVRVANTSSSMTHCVIKDSDGIGLLVTGTTNTITNVTVYNTSPASTSGALMVTAAATGCVMSDVVVAGMTTGNATGFLLSTPASFTQLDYLYASSASSGLGTGGSGGITMGPGAGGLTYASGNGLTANHWFAHTNGNNNIAIAGVTDFNITDIDTWTPGGGTASLVLNQVARMTFTNLRAQTGGPCVQLSGGCMFDVLFVNSFIAGSLASGGLGIIANLSARNVVFHNVAFGASGGGFYAANFTTKDVTTQNSTNNQNNYDITFSKCTFDQSITATMHDSTRAMNGSTFRFQRGNGTAGNHFTDILGTGTVSRETTTFDATPSIKMTPTSAVLKLDTAGGELGNGFYIPVDNGGTPTVSVKIQKDGSYNGNPPRLILKRNAALGVTADTVLGTFSGSLGSFQTVSGTCPAATDVGVYEVVVDCDGTAGNIYVDTLTVSGAGASAVSGLNYWFAGLAC